MPARLRIATLACTGLLSVVACTASEAHPRATQHARGAPAAAAAPDTTPGDSLPLHRWTEAEGSRVVGSVPADAYDEPVTAGAVCTDAIVLWRDRGEAGDYFLTEPWLLRPGRAGVSLGQPDVHPDWHWLPGCRQLVTFTRRDVQLVDTTGRVVRTLAVSADTTRELAGLAVHPDGERIAIALADEHRAPADDAALLDLVVMALDGTPLARVQRFARSAPDELNAVRIPLFWLPDGRVAFTARTGREPAPTGEGGEPRTLQIADPVRGRIDTTAVAVGRVVTTVPDGRLLLDDGRLFDPATGALADQARPDRVFLGASRFSPDGRWLTALVQDDDAVHRVGVLRASDGRWRELGPGAVLGWSPDGALYWIGARTRSDTTTRSPAH